MKGLGLRSTHQGVTRAMHRLSAPSTRSCKRAFPLFWFGGLATVLTLSGAAFIDPGAWVSSGQLVSFAFPFVLIGIGSLFIFRMLIADLVDEVWLDGNELSVKSRGRQARIALADVMNVNVTSMTSPRRITLMLRTGSSFGHDITFIPAGSSRFVSMFEPDPIATELIGRVDALRTPAP